MTPIRVLVWAGALGWAAIALNFAASLLLRAASRQGRAQGGLRLRLTWALAALGAAAFLVSRLQPLPYGLRVVLDVALALGGVALALAMAVTLAQRGLGVLR